LAACLLPEKNLPRRKRHFLRPARDDKSGRTHTSDILLSRESIRPRGFYVGPTFPELDFPWFQQVICG
jgi:hypothetical protein